MRSSRTNRPGRSSGCRPGPRDRVAITVGRPPAIVHEGEAPSWSDAAAQRSAAQPDDVAIDLDGRATADALARGREALGRLPAALLRLGGARIAAGDTDAPERLVPRYASPPRGAPIEQPDGGVAWSRDPR